LKSVGVPVTLAKRLPMPEAISNAAKQNDGCATAVRKNDCNAKRKSRLFDHADLWPIKKYQAKPPLTNNNLCTVLYCLSSSKKSALKNNVVRQGKSFMPGFSRIQNAFLIFQISLIVSADCVGLKLVFMFLH
jgi:hypothetical protein